MVKRRNHQTGHRKHLNPERRRKDGHSRGIRPHLRPNEGADSSILPFVVYPESTPAVEPHRAFLDLHGARIGA